MSHSVANPVSPTLSTGRKGSNAIGILDAVPLDSPHRTTPIHPSITSIRLPSDAGKTNLNPITLKPFTDAELKLYGFDKLRTSLGSKEEVGHAKEDAIKHLKDRLEEREKKAREIEHDMSEKEKIREVERKVYRKRMGEAKEG